MYSDTVMSDEEILEVYQQLGLDPNDCDDFDKKDDSTYDLLFRGVTQDVSVMLSSTSL